MFGKALYNVYFSKHSVQYIIHLTSLVHTNVKIPQVFFTNKEADFGRKLRKILTYRLLEFSLQPHWKDDQMGPGYDNLVLSYQTLHDVYYIIQKRRRRRKKAVGPKLAPDNWNLWYLTFYQPVHSTQAVALLPYQILDPVGTILQAHCATVWCQTHKQSL